MWSVTFPMKRDVSVDPDLQTTLDKLPFQRKKICPDKNKSVVRMFTFCFRVTFIFVIFSHRGSFAKITVKAHRGDTGVLLKGWERALTELYANASAINILNVVTEVMTVNKKLWLFCSFFLWIVEYHEHFAREFTPQVYMIFEFYTLRQWRALERNKKILSSEIDLSFIGCVFTLTKCSGNNLAKVKNPPSALSNISVIMWL